MIADGAIGKAQVDRWSLAPNPMVTLNYPCIKLPRLHIIGEKGMSEQNPPGTDEHLMVMVGGGAVQVAYRYA